MKKIIGFLFCCFLLLSCEDVINIDLPTAPPRLVIDAAINWKNGTAGNEQQIKLSLSAPYFNLDIPAANGAEVRINDSANNSFTFIEDENTGIYKNTDFIPVIDREYQLTVIYENETYTAVETLKSVAPIDYIEQNNDGGFLGDEIEIKAFYTDPANDENFYFFEFENDIPTIPTLEVYDDVFTNGNEIFAFYTEEELSQGNTLFIRNYGISRAFYDFMFILLQQNGDNGGGPFETQPATLRGNCVNTTNSENFPFGYFRLSQVDEFIYVVN